MPNDMQDHDRYGHEDHHEGHDHHDHRGPKPGWRNRFFPQKAMKAESFRIEQQYFLQRRRLMTRSIMGWGIAFGLGLDVKNSKVTRGLAIDEAGREIEVISPNGVVLNQDNVFLLKRGEPCPDGLDEMDEDEQQYLLSIHYAEKDVISTMVSDNCGCHKEWQYVRETVLFSLTPASERLCREPADDRKTSLTPDACGARQRGPHRQLSEWSKELVVSEDQELSDRQKWRDMRVDHSRGIALAYVKAKRPDPCGPLTLSDQTDEHSPRRLIKRNDMLYDLIQGKDLTRIESISWAAYHRRSEKKPIPFKEFLAFLNLQPDEDPAPAATTAAVDAAAPGEGTPPNAPVAPALQGVQATVGAMPEKSEQMRTDLSVTFSGPVDVTTLLADCFSLNFMVFASDTGWRDMRFVPVGEPIIDKKTEGDPDESTRKVTLKVDKDWAEEVTKGANVFQLLKFRMEILIHGDFILDMRGQAIDANARGLALSSRGGGEGGNGTPGGTFRSLLWIEKADASRGGGT
ncbi:hypothetical protein QTH90_21015 [Variovorax sp. J2P1-59]|uniref:hypothetical protein n=1 Tax=Variovorax flavidus TaxID=3053501 RepID=UPI00257692B2|nr:hypothetical protein [Variovorax sp. J2P1-59]MDM0076903.1 hypothetical protein [Variovorax sp. J2P1-59]